MLYQDPRSWYNASMYLVVERRRIMHPEHKAGICAHPDASVLLRIRFVVGSREGGRVRTRALEHWGCIRECCAKDKQDPLGRDDYWECAANCVKEAPSAAAYKGDWPEWEEREEQIAAVVPKLTAIEKARVNAWRGVRLSCRKWDDGCAPHGRRRCDVCILSRVERRRLDWTRVERAGAAWRRYHELKQREPEPANSTRLDLALQFFDAAYTLGLPHFPCSRELVLAAHKLQILLEHPDLGGSTERAAKVNSARDQLLAALDSRRVSGW